MKKTETIEVVKVYCDVCGKDCWLASHNEHTLNGKEYHTCEDYECCVDMRERLRNESRVVR